MNQLTHTYIRNFEEPKEKNCLVFICLHQFYNSCLGPNLIAQGDKVRVVQTLLFVEGINTLLQTLFGTRLPTVIGGSYAFMVPIISIIHDPSLMSIEDNHVVSLLKFSHPHFLALISMFVLFSTNLDSNGDDPEFF